MDDLIKTGIRGLDDILFGGVKRGNILLVEGSPGTGKTTLGLEFIHRGIVENDEPGLIVTFEMSPAKLLRDAAGFGWDLQKSEDEGRLKMIYTSPLVLLQELHSHDGLLMQEIRRIKAKRLLLDGLTPLKLFGELFNGRPFRDSLYLLVETLQREEITAMLTREVPESEEARAAQFSHEQFICDTILTLRSEFSGRNRVRSLTVAKSRGQDFVAGRHTLRIEANRGVRIYPRAQSRIRHVEEQPTSTQRSSLGVPAVDEMIGKGVFDGSATLIVGVSGTGKTVLGVEFLVEGAKQGKPGLLVTLDEHPAQIMRNAEGLDLPLEKIVDQKLVHFYYESPQELELDVHYDRITRLVEEHKIERVLIDSLAAYMTSEDRIREFHDFIYALTTFFKDRLVTAFMNYESPELLGVSQLSQEIKVSTIVDNIILLNYVEFSNRLRRAITVPKARGSAPSRVTREYRISKGGIQLEPHDITGDVESIPQLPFSAYYGVLARSPARRSPLIDEQIYANSAVKDVVDDSGSSNHEKRAARKAAPASTRKKFVGKKSVQSTKK
ncbi:ATPase domain-containing protein [Verrucomicrobiota bacterium sgz303538]